MRKLTLRIAGLTAASERLSSEFHMYGGCVRLILLAAVLPLGLAGCASSGTVVGAGAAAGAVPPASGEMPDSVGAEPPPPPPPPPPVERGERDGPDYDGAEMHHGGKHPARGSFGSLAGNLVQVPIAPGVSALPRGPLRAAADPRVYCDVTGKFMTASLCEEAKTIAANARLGLGNVEYPDTITRGETRMVALTVRRAAPGEAVPAPTGGAIASNRSFSLKVTGRMAALLEGEGFKIEPDKIQYRDIGISDGARWEWNITALKAPHHHLTMTAYMVVEAPDGSSTDSAIVPSKEMDIPVKVTFEQRFLDFVEWIANLSKGMKTMIVALTGVVVALIAFRSKLAELVSGRSGGGDRGAVVEQQVQ